MTQKTGWLGLPADWIDVQIRTSAFEFAITSSKLPLVSGTGAPPATRIGDADVPHCSGMVRMEGSPDVFVNGIPWSRLTDHNTPHLKFCVPDCCIHTFPIVSGSKTVFINGLEAGRVGDPTCTSVAEGSPNVFCGD